MLCWKVSAGEQVSEGQLLGEVVCVENPFQPRTPIITRTAGMYGCVCVYVCVCSVVCCSTVGIYMLEHSVCF